MDFTFRLQNMDRTNVLRQPRVKYEIGRLAWRSYGYCYDADVAFGGDPMEVANMAKQVGKRIEIVAPNGTVCWWGFIESVELTTGTITKTISIEKMTNRVNVLYSEVDFAGETVPKETGWIENADSIITFGKKESKPTLQQATADSASKFANRTLDARKFAIVEKDISTNAPNALSGTLRLKGDWALLDWLFYAYTGGKTSYETEGDGERAIGDGSGILKAVGAFIMPIGTTASYRYIGLKVQRVGAPTDNFIVQIAANVAGSPDAPGTILQTASVEGASLPTSMSWVTFTMPATQQMTAGTKYWIVFSRSGAASGSNYYKVDVNATPGITNYMVTWGGSAWAAANPAATLLVKLGGEEDLIAQLLRVVDTAYCGQFFKGSDSNFANAGVAENPYRDGMSTGLACAEEMMSKGTSNNYRILSNVTPDGYVRFFGEPQRTDPISFSIKANGKVYEFPDRELPLWEYGKAVGRWLRLIGVMPGSTSEMTMIDSDVMFCDGIDVDVTNGTARMIERTAEAMIGG